jgi:hypothetical protein
MVRETDEQRQWLYGRVAARRQEKASSVIEAREFTKELQSFRALAIPRSDYVLFI